MVWLNDRLLWNWMPVWLWKLWKQQWRIEYCRKQHKGSFQHKGFLCYSGTVSVGLCYAMSER
jgi:hypothetical protein